MHCWIRLLGTDFIESCKDGVIDCLSVIKKEPTIISMNLVSDGDNGVVVSGEISCCCVFDPYIGDIHLWGAC